VPVFSLKGERSGSPDTKKLLIMADISRKCLLTVSRAMIAVPGGVVVALGSCALQLMATVQTQ